MKEDASSGPKKGRELLEFLSFLFSVRERRKEKEKEGDAYKRRTMEHGDERKPEAPNRLYKRPESGGEYSQNKRLE